MDDEDEFEMRLIEKRNRQRLIAKGVRNDPVQKGSTPSALPPQPEKPTKAGNPPRSFSDWFKTLSKTKPSLHTNRKARG